MAWHDCLYTPWDSVMHLGLEMARLGKRGYVPNESPSGYDGSMSRLVHQAIAGKVQSAIASLPPEYQAFGHHLYAPVVSVEQSNAWEEAALHLLAGHVGLVLERRNEKRRCIPYSREYFIARGVLVRYRHMVQGGMGANPDPMSDPWVFRGWLADQHGIDLDSRNWTRNWGWLIQVMFDVAGDIDGFVLGPVGRAIGSEREAA